MGAYSKLDLARQSLDDVEDRHYTQYEREQELISKYMTGRLVTKQELVDAVGRCCDGEFLKFAEDLANELGFGENN